MNLRRMSFCVLLFFTLNFSFFAIARAQTLEPLAKDLRKSLEDEAQAQSTAIAALADRSTRDRSDAAIFSKGLHWALKYDREFKPADIALLKKASARGTERLAALSARSAKMESSVEGNWRWVTRRASITPFNPMA